MRTSGEPKLYREAARELLRDTLLDAARDELERRSWGEITMRDIARTAGVSRQTLYKEFGSREEFARALVMRESDRFLVAVEGALRGRLDDPRAALAGAFDVFLTAARGDPLVRSIVLDGAENGLLALVTTGGGAIVGRAAERLAEVMVAGWPMLERGAADLLAECLVRLGISYATLPAGPAGLTATSVSTVLGPYLEDVLADAGQEDRARLVSGPGKPLV